MSELRRAVFILALAVLMLGIAVLLLAGRPSPTAQDAPTPSQGGAGRPKSPGVAYMSTSAPRSAPNLPLVVDASSSTHGQAGTSGRIGAPRNPGGDSLEGGALARSIRVTSLGAPPTEGWPSSKALVSKTSERVERTGVQILYLPPFGESSDEASPPPAKRLSVHAQGFESPALRQTHIGTAAGAIRGVASYYGTGPAGVAAAGPNLRAALGSHWRGTWVRVTYAFTEMDSRGRVRHRSRSAWLRLGDACWCRVADIDIPTRTFSYLSRGELWRGLLRVTITWGDAPRLPQTDTAP